MKDRRGAVRALDWMRAALVVLMGSLFLVACGAAPPPKPLPGGPPPEYEPPRDYDMGAGAAPKSEPHEAAPSAEPAPKAAPSSEPPAAPAAPPK